jgi:hypothetical protein
MSIQFGLITGCDNDGPRPRLRGVKGCPHADLAPVQAMAYGQSTIVDQSVLVIAKSDECIV